MATGTTEGSKITSTHVGGGHDPDACIALLQDLPKLEVLDVGGATCMNRNVLNPSGRRGGRDAADVSNSSLGTTLEGL